MIDDKEMKARTIAIARGEYQPRPDEPKVWSSPDFSATTYCGAR
jgi:hypothetical protein